MFLMLHGHKMQKQTRDLYRSKVEEKLNLQIILNTTQIDKLHRNPMHSVHEKIQLVFDFSGL